MDSTKKYIGKNTLSSSKYGNAFLFEQEQLIQKRRIKKLQWIFVLLLIIGYITAALAQQLGSSQNYTITSTF